MDDYGRCWLLFGFFCLIELPSKLHFFFLFSSRAFVEWWCLPFTTRPLPGRSSSSFRVCVGRFTILPIQSTMEKKLLYSWYRGLAATKLTSYSGCWRTGLQSHELFSLNCNAFEIPFRDATRCKIWLPFLKNGISRFKWFKSQRSFVN